MSTQQSSDPTVQSLLDELWREINGPLKASIRDVGVYGCVLRAALAKSFELTSYVNRDPAPEHSFFITSTLRGVCEDLIVLSFVAKLNHTERDEAIALLIEKSAIDGMKAQSEFFGSTRPWQPVLKVARDSSSVESRLRALAKLLGWTGKKHWPSVGFMAKATSLSPLYSYIYATTSKWVHFSPHILLRTGWGGRPDEVGEEIRWSFTSKNFADYYGDFNKIYSLMLLLHLLRGPAAGMVPKGASTIIQSLQTSLDMPLRWPEDVTWEEMN